MNNLNKKYKKYKSQFLIGIISLFLWACDKGNDADPKLDFSNYVAVGNSLTAGISNNGLYNESIKNAYPNLIAQQLKLVGGGNFPIALFPAGKENGTGYLKLAGYNGIFPNIITEEKNTAIVSLQPPVLTKYVGENNNLGMPFMKMTDIDNPNLRQTNLFFERLLPENSEKPTYLAYLSKYKPTFFSCWLGNNDVLTFASSGGTRPISDQLFFETNLKKLLDQLTKNGAKGVVGNIGDVASAPAIFLLTAIRPLISNAKIYIQTKSGVREGTLNDYLLLPTNLSNANELATKATDKTKPWADAEVLDSEEVAELQLAILAFNTIIKREAEARNLAYMDANSFLKKLKGGYTENGETVSSDFITGGIFSLDGAHLTPKGYAFTANEFIKAINSHYKTTVPLLDTKLYKGVEVQN